MIGGAFFSNNQIYDQCLINSWWVEKMTQITVLNEYNVVCFNIPGKSFNFILKDLRISDR